MISHKQIQDEGPIMELILLGALAGGCSGALGHLTASKIHEKEKAEKIYPLYALVFFSILVVCAQLSRV